MSIEIISIYDRKSANRAIYDRRPQDSKWIRIKFSRESNHLPLQMHARDESGTEIRNQNDHSGIWH